MNQRTEVKMQKKNIICHMINFNSALCLFFIFFLFFIPKSGYGRTGQQRLCLSASIPPWTICTYHLPFSTQNSLKVERTKYKLPFIAIVFVLSNISITLELLNIVRLFQPFLFLWVHITFKTIFCDHLS